MAVARPVGDTVATEVFWDDQRAVLVTSRVDPSLQRTTAVSWLVSPIALRDLRPSTISDEGVVLPEGVAVIAEGWARSLEPPQAAAVSARMAAYIRVGFT
jgi:hypothetical protein